MKPPLFSSREFKQSDTEICVKNVKFGGKRIVIIAGPCTVVDKQELFETASQISKSKAAMLRGGAFKTRTSPRDFQGLGSTALKLLHEASRAYNLPIVTEITDFRDVDLIEKYADMIQIGARNMQNTALLKAVGESKLPVLLKRGFGNTVSELLSAADYILAQGNKNVVLCERGIRSFENSTRFSLDILAIPVIKTMSHLPLIVDPSHAAGNRGLVISASKAAIAAGADGLLIEVTSHPDTALVDGDQTLTTDQFQSLMEQLEVLIPAIGREV
ncbi:3-deoxy-7-phosphoheptulonate synthase [Dehalogenimonas etheniformans]|uniref:3-deoxy-7-phosphoheptulonate synthase n=1 Tax=Dehalogenimonas etheniformans TaxID=1536648 RepID=A0A2P5PA89_9CHLR|nr:3-deoxy-7-phosphoheptulonate synthase [Dehalogenimonas etheniformans]PPD59197.1 3-deoxy-7-phosphoheptulonate synthase [Dehalogenimonas etheniformans]QNT75760.1 3-deoxy-7-phosphoheptulonate synthase [Dehalogenimonas etheniformans]